MENRRPSRDIKERSWGPGGCASLAGKNRKNGVIRGMGEVGHARDLEEDLRPRNSSLMPLLPFGLENGVRSLAPSMLPLLPFGLENGVRSLAPSILLEEAGGLTIGGPY